MNDLKTNQEAKKKQRLELAAKLKKLYLEFNRTSSGDHLRLLGTLLSNAHLTTLLMTLPKGASSLLLGLVFALEGIRTSESQAGALGKYLSKIADELAQGLTAIEFWQPKPDLEAQLIIDKVVTGAILGSLILGRWIGTRWRDLDVKESKETSRVASDLILILMASTPYVKVTFAELIKALGGNQKTTERAAEVLTFVFVYLTGFSVIKTRQQTLEYVLELLHQFFESSISKLDDLIFENEMRASYLQLAVQQAKLAIQVKSPEAFIQAKETLFEGLKISNEEFESDCELMFQAADALFACFAEATQAMQPPGTALSVIA